MAYLVLALGSVLLILGIIFRVMRLDRPDLAQRYDEPQAYIHFLATVQIAIGSALLIDAICALLIASMPEWLAGVIMIVLLVSDFILIARRQLRDRRNDPRDRH